MLIAICDDDPVQLGILNDAVLECGPLRGEDIVIETFASGSDLLSAVESGKRYAYIFLDIEMPHMSGYDICDEISSEGTSIIFVTAHTSYLSEVYPYRYHGFIPKPYTQAQFDRSVSSAQELRGDLQRFTYTESGGEHHLPCRDIYYFAVDNHYLIIHKSTGTLSLHRVTMQSAVAQISGFGFFRCSRSHLVNLRHCVGRKESAVEFRSYCKIRTNEVTIARQKEKEFDRRLFDYKKGERYGH